MGAATSLYTSALIVLPPSCADTRPTATSRRPAEKKDTEKAMIAGAEWRVRTDRPARVDWRCKLCIAFAGQEFRASSAMEAAW